MNGEMKAIAIELGDTLSNDMDELLGLYRRGAFDRDLTERTAGSEQLGEPLALVIVDLDKFKAINDAHGHPAGDEVLQSVARTIKQTVGKKGTSYRYGGEELSILLPNYTADEAAALAERIRRLIDASSIGSKGLGVTASFGIAEVPTHASTGDELLKLADSALYEAKNLGRNLVRISGETTPSAPGPSCDPPKATRSEWLHGNRSGENTGKLLSLQRRTLSARTKLVEDYAVSTCKPKDAEPGCVLPILRIVRTDSRALTKGHFLYLNCYALRRS